jgi:hypothetical protein
MRENLDPLIKREFEALGLNIVENDMLADMVIERVTKKRARKWLVSGGAVLVGLLLALLCYVIGTSSLFHAGGSTVQSNSYNIAADPSGGLSIPQFANIYVTPKNRTFTFTFALKPGEVMESFVDSTQNSLGGIVGQLRISKHHSNQLIDGQPLGAGSSSHEFGNIDQPGLYDFVISYDDNAFTGKVRVAFLLGHRE